MASRLMGGGGQSAKLENIGDRVSGFLVEEPGEAQQTVFNDKSTLKFYKNGQPAMMSILKLQTQQRNDQNDDGIRLVFVADLSDKQDEIARAIRATGANDIEVGGFLDLALVNKVPGQNNNLKNVWQAQYQRPQSGLMGGQQQQAPPHNSMMRGPSGYFPPGAGMQGQQLPPQQQQPQQFNGNVPQQVTPQQWQQQQQQPDYGQQFAQQYGQTQQQQQQPQFQPNQPANEDPWGVPQQQSLMNGPQQQAQPQQQAMPDLQPPQNLQPQAQPQQQPPAQAQGVTLPGGYQLPPGVDAAAVQAAFEGIGQLPPQGQ